MSDTKKSGKHTKALPVDKNLFVRLVSKNKRLIVGGVAFVLFLALLQEVISGQIVWLDTLAYRILVLRMRTGWLTPIMQSISELALPVVLLVMLLAVEAFAPGRRPGACAALNLVLVFILNQSLKMIVHRPRPEGFRLIAENGYSFPSGHSMIAMAFYGLLAWMVWHYEKDRIVKWICVTGFALVIVAIGLSRVYLGVHYASDVLAGFAVSIVWLSIYTKVIVPVLMHRPGEPGERSHHDAHAQHESHGRHEQD